MAVMVRALFFGALVAAEIHDAGFAPHWMVVGLIAAGGWFLLEATAPRDDDNSWSDWFSD